MSYYRRGGLDLPVDNTTPEDHLGFELQFVAELADRANAAIAADDAGALTDAVDLGRSFFVHHQANWLQAFCDAVDEFAQTDFYRAVATMTRGYVESESAFFAEIAELLGLGDAVEEVRPSWAAEGEAAS